MIVYAFPGQGSQSLGMGLDLAAHFKVFHTLGEEASEVLGYNLIELVSDGEKLGQTQFTQPALLWAGYASYRAWMQHAQDAVAMPDYVCGHSLGEYTALVVAEVISFADAIALVSERGKLMQQQIAPEQALMAAIIGLSDDKVTELCEAVCELAGDDTALQSANFNAEGQVVVAGKSTSLETLKQLGKSLGAKRILPLQVSVVSHCELMRPASEALSQYAKTIKFTDARYPVVQNVDAVARTDAGKIRTALVSQLTSPVRWRHSLATFSKATNFIESGPGAVLQGLAKRAMPDTKICGIGSKIAFNQTAETFQIATI